MESQGGLQDHESSMNTKRGETPGKTNAVTKEASETWYKRASHLGILPGG